MKKITLVLSLLVSASSFAEEVPKPVLEVIKVFQHSSYYLNDGVLSMTMTKPSVNEDIATSFFRGICDTLFVGKDWQPSLIKTVVIKNSSEDQKVVINGGGLECKKLGPMNMNESETYIKSLVKK
ncbi:hypothetical protein GQQ23_12935 [Pantoea agglomerans]|uniref:hypothetical protein n=1 Tax=Enterobacter agglomerans TaxID=549 RepID=UPI0013CD7945|nr:hypothetical protein [Pantoea agglomerans]NEG63235.1 hypothetical protein [Pantoea agglomerans]